MRKWFAVVVLAVTLMAFFAPNAQAATWIYYQGVWIKVGSLEVTSEWFAKTLDLRPATYAVTITPLAGKVHFANPGGNLGGDASVNFGGAVTTTANGIVNPALVGKKNITDTIVFGDCGNCDPAVADLPVDGALWLLFMNPENLCESNNPVDTDRDGDGDVDNDDAEAGYYARINCVKTWLTETYEPNSQWTPVSVLLENFDLVLRAWQDYDKDGDLDETVYAQYYNFTLQADGTYTSTNENNCVWQFSYPKSLTSCSTSCCDPDEDVCNPFTELCLW